MQLNFETIFATACPRMPHYTRMSSSDAGALGPATTSTPSISSSLEAPLVLEPGIAAEGKEFRVENGVVQDESMPRAGTKMQFAEIPGNAFCLPLYTIETSE